MRKLTFRPFSKRHQDAISENRLKPSIPLRLRRRIRALLQEYNYCYEDQPNPHDSWTENTSHELQVERKLKKIHGWEELEGFVEDKKRQVDFEGFLRGAYPAHVLDVVELFYLEMEEDLPSSQKAFQSEINAAFEDESCPWVLCDGCFMQLDSRFLEEHVLSRTQELLAEAKFEGTLQEFVEARNDLVSGDHKGAVHSACKAFESTLKALGETDHGTPKILIDALKKSGFYEGFPPSLVDGFGDNVLMALPFIRNRVGGHGQGAEVVEVPRSLAELTVHLAGTFIVFLVKRHLEVSGRDDEAQENKGFDDTGSDLPF